jgi:zinc D-Ala-D-Ala carboxypeptidase
MITLRPYFTYSEFDSPDQPGSGRLMQDRFLRKLLTARKIAGIPFIITSGYRTPEHNRRVGGVPHSAHTRGLAADISATTPHQYKTILKALIQAGFRRIGLGPNFIHVDDDHTKPYPAVWTYSKSRHYNDLASKLTAIFRNEQAKKKGGFLLAATITAAIIFGIKKH